MLLWFLKTGSYFRINPCLEEGLSSLSSNSNKSAWIFLFKDLGYRAQVDWNRIP